MEMQKRNGKYCGYIGSGMCNLLHLLPHSMWSTVVDT